MSDLDRLLNHRKPDPILMSERTIGPVDPERLERLLIGDWLPRKGSPDTICGRLYRIVIDDRGAYFTIGPPWHLLRHIRKLRSE